MFLFFLRFHVTCSYITKQAKTQIKTMTQHYNNNIIVLSFRDDVIITLTTKQGVCSEEQMVYYSEKSKGNWMEDSQFHADLILLSMQQWNDHVNKALHRTYLLLFVLMLPENWQFCLLCSIRDVKKYLPDSINAACIINLRQLTSCRHGLQTLVTSH